MVRTRKSFVVPAIVGLLLLATPGASRSASPLYPDLRSLPPRDLRFDTVTVDQTTHHVLRFTTTVWNAGEGPLELRGVSSEDRTLVYQRVYDRASDFAEQLVGEFVFHVAHNHWHFEEFAEYELWTAADYERWLASDGGSGGEQDVARWRGSKTTGQGESVCVRDSRPVDGRPDSPPSRVYRSCDRDVQGVSVGWGDTYRYTLPEQWIDLGETPLPDGNYVLRQIADPRNLLYESGDRGDPDREGPGANAAITAFTVRGDRVRARRD